MSVLSALARAYERLPDKPAQGYSTEKIGFVIGLNDDGSVAVVAARGDAGAKRKNIPPMLVPQPAKKSVNISPNFLWGNSAYVLGVTAREDKKKERLSREHAAFVQYHLEILHGTDDPGLAALYRFLQGWSPDRFAPPLWPDAIKDQNIVFALEKERRQDIYLHNRDAAKALWAKSNRNGASSDSLCLVTGERAPAARLHASIKGVWGAQSSGASIVSFNKDSFESHGHVQGDNAPISESIVFQYTTALNTFLTSGRNRVQIGDATTVFWADAADSTTAETAETTFAAMCSPIDPDVEAGKVGDILERIRNGQPLRDFAPDLADGVRFYVLGLSPNAARLSIRFWFENDFAVLASNYQKFVDEIRIAPPPRDPYPALWRFLIETAVLGKRENVPPNLAGEWMRSILTGTAYPLTLLSTVLMRIRADGTINALRVAMLKALLIRNFKIGKEAPVALDPKNPNKGYLLGRLFATYEQAQSAALGRNVNATIKDKYYGAASAQPRKVFPLLDRGSANHLSKIGKQRMGQRVNLEKTLAAIFDRMAPADDPFPAALNAEDQALFALGYYHQRNEFFTKTEPADAEDAAS